MIQSKRQKVHYKATNHAYQKFSPTEWSPGIVRLNYFDTKNAYAERMHEASSLAAAEMHGRLSGA